MAGSAPETNDNSHSLGRWIARGNRFHQKTVRNGFAYSADELMIE